VRNRFMSVRTSAFFVCAGFAGCALPGLEVDENWNGSAAGNIARGGGAGMTMSGGMVGSGSGGGGTANVGGANGKGGAEGTSGSVGAGGEMGSGGTPSNGGSSANGGAAGAGGNVSAGAGGTDAPWVLCDPSYAPATETGCPPTTEGSPPACSSNPDFTPFCVYCENNAGCPAEPNHVVYACGGSTWTQGEAGAGAVGCICPPSQPTSGSSCDEIGDIRSCYYGPVTCTCDFLEWDCL
jgi:hypothetical protein